MALAQPQGHHRLRSLLSQLTPAARPPAGGALISGDAITPQHAEFVSYRAVPRFEPGSPEASDFLDREGFCVFKEVLSTTEVADTLDMIWWFLEAQVHSHFTVLPGQICVSE